MRSKKHLIPVAVIVLILAALACGPVVEGVGENAAANLEETADAALQEFEAMATEIGPTVEAELTNAQPTIDAELTALADTLEEADTDADTLAETAEAAGSVFAATAEAATDLVSIEGDMITQWAADANATSQYGADSWSAMQATGAPDTTECGDIPTAWASESASGVDTLTLTYLVPVVPTQINIYETYTPGSIVRVSVIDIEGVETVVYEAQPTAIEDCPRVLTIDTTVDALVNQVAITVDQSVVGNWNEIDAVQLVGGGAQ